MKLHIQLQNPAADIDAVTHALSRTDIRAVIESGQIVLRTEMLVPGAIDPADADLVFDVWQRIVELLAVVSGAGRVEGATLPRLELAAVTYEDASGVRQFLPDIGRMRGVLPGVRATPPDPSKLVAFALRDAAAAKALRLASRELDWCNLYRIFEVIAEAVGEGQIVRNCWATASEIDAFKCSANNQLVTGDDARHGKTIKGTPRNTLELPDAQHLIKHILRLWLNEKAAAAEREQA